MKYEAIAIGCSAGGFKFLKHVLGKIPENFPIPIVILCHQESDRKSLLAELLNRVTKLPVVEAQLGIRMEHGHIYVAPPSYHMFLEPDFLFSFSLEEKVSYSRPSVDVLFKSMADVLGPKLIAVLATGANSDGAQGLKHIRHMQGIAIVQNPETAEVSMMPEAGIEIAGADYILDLEEIAGKLVSLTST